MKTQQEPKTHKVRVLRARRIAKKSYAEECKELQRKIYEERNGELMPDSTDIIRAMRDGDLR